MWTLLNKIGLLKGKIVISLRLLELYFPNVCSYILLGETDLTATYLINRLPSWVIEGVSSVQLMTTFYPFIPIMTSLQSRVFGCHVFVYVHSSYRGKLDPRTIKCVFIGYASNKKGYKCYHPQSCKFYVSKDVTFHETESFSLISQLQGESIQEAEVLDVRIYGLKREGEGGELFKRGFGKLFEV